MLSDLPIAETDAGLVPNTRLEFPNLVLKKQIRVHGGFCDVLDCLENMFSNRKAANKALQRGLGSGPQMGPHTTILGFDANVFKRVRWAGDRSPTGCLVAPLNVCATLMLSLQSREGVELRASVGTALARAMLKQSGHSDAQIEAMEARPVAVAVEGQSVGNTHIHIASAPAPAAAVEAPSTDVQIAPLRPMETTGLRDEIADLSTLPNVSEEMRKQLIESRVKLVVSVNSSLAGIAEARLDGERLDNEIKRKSAEAEERRAPGGAREEGEVLRHPRRDGREPELQ